MLDSLDRALLTELQADNQQTHAQLGAKVGLSASSVRRRVTALRERGVIEAEVAVLAPEAVGVQAIVFVTFGEESIDGDDSFRQRMRAAPEVQQCYSVAGDVDYVLVVHAPDLASYEAWGKRVLMADPTIRRYDTHLVWSRIKFSTAIPLVEDGG
ncbi:MAG: Lrp/AsnC family transcriptional regulator [Bacteroidota bacterium]